MENLLSLVSSPIVRDILIVIVVINMIHYNNKQSKQMETLINKLDNIISRFEINKYQADIIKGYFFGVQKYRFIRDMFRIYNENNFHKKEDVINNIKAQIKNIVRDTDNDLLKITGMEKYLIPTKLKIEYLESNGIAEKIYNMLNDVKNLNASPEKKNELLRIRMSNLYDTLFDGIVEWYFKKTDKSEV